MYWSYDKSIRIASCCSSRGISEECYVSFLILLKERLALLNLRFKDICTNIKCYIYMCIYYIILHIHVFIQGAHAGLIRS